MSSKMVNKKCTIQKYLRCFLYLKIEILKDKSPSNTDQISLFNN